MDKLELYKAFRYSQDVILNSFFDYLFHHLTLHATDNLGTENEVEDGVQNKKHYMEFYFHKRLNHFKVFTYNNTDPKPQPFKETYEKIGKIEVGLFINDYLLKVKAYGAHIPKNLKAERNIGNELLFYVKDMIDKY